MDGSEGPVFKASAVAARNDGRPLKTAVAHHHRQTGSLVRHKAGGWAMVTADDDGDVVNEILRGRAAGTDDPAVRPSLCQPSQSQPSSSSFLHFNSLPPLSQQTKAVGAGSDGRGGIR